jgi:hypothetical protein
MLVSEKLKGVHDSLIHTKMSLYNDDTLLPLRIRTPPPDNDDDERVYKKAVEGLSRASYRRNHLTILLCVLLLVGLGCGIRIMNGYSFDIGDYTPIVLLCLFVFGVCYFTSETEIPSRYDPV